MRYETMNLLTKIFLSSIGILTSTTAGYALTFIPKQYNFLAMLPFAIAAVILLMDMLTDESSAYDPNKPVFSATFWIATWFFGVATTALTFVEIGMSGNL